MLFNSFEFLLFLLLTTCFYFYLNKARFVRASKTFLVIASLSFYSWWDINYLPLLLGSMAFNYLVGSNLGKSPRRLMLGFGIISNVILLGYFKYTDFLIVNYNFAFSTDVPMANLILPLAISYFTFQQIAFLVDSYRGETKDYDFLNYSVFITFFPQLLMGPIMHHKDIIPQFSNKYNFFLKWNNVSLGLFIFSIGLAKKCLLGDPLSGYAQTAFDSAQDLTMIEAWYASVSYVLAFYFDLSGYADMAIGVGKIFNINIPLNFNSPYKARNFADYWRRWHMTLSKFLGDYVYKSLGGNSRSAKVIYLNIMITFLVSGIWHGAGWTFVVWGLINGALVVSAHMMKKAKIELNYILAWSMMFFAVVVTRILFVSNDFSDAWYVTYTLFDISNLSFSNLEFAEKYTQTPLILAGLLISLGFKNSIEISKGFKPNKKYLALTSVLFIASMLTFHKAKEFLYFQF